MSRLLDNVANINPADEVSPTEQVAGVLVTMDDGVDVDQAQNDIAEVVNGLMSVSDNDSDVVSRKSEHNLSDLSLY